MDGEVKMAAALERDCGEKGGNSAQRLIVDCILIRT